MQEGETADIAGGDDTAKRKALKIVGEAFGRCEAEDIDGIIAIGVFLDHIIAHLVSMNNRTMTAAFLETLASRVRDGIYDHAVGLDHDAVDTQNPEKPKKPKRPKKTQKPKRSK